MVSSFNLYSPQNCLKEVDGSSRITIQDFIFAYEIIDLSTIRALNPLVILAMPLG
jgi:hypothetical protein